MPKETKLRAAFKMATAAVFAAVPGHNAVEGWSAADYLLLKHDQRKNEAQTPDE